MNSSFAGGFPDGATVYEGQLRDLDQAHRGVHEKPCGTAERGTYARRSAELHRAADDRSGIETGRNRDQ
ncbi:hypothetical protein ACIBHX_47430 [Nonomuraea sp. NPDC050536]|uniref:hypothetical protein n=1 Tax=Nonomuraea sp. NPDC050536 TaxID=3364366 RepID=UPI0037C96FCB